MDGEVPAAAQISQADIIERQAQTIARLQRQVDKGVEYKRLTKSKLKEAAARLREYRVRVETLLADQKKDQKKTQTRNGATQTDPKKGVTRACQTKLTGPVQRINRKIQVDVGVQTVDTLTSRKRGREMSTQTEVDQFIPKLSRDVGRSVDSMNDVWTSQEPLQMLGDVNGGQMAFLQATSAALDAELAFSDSEDGTGDTLGLDSGQETEDIAKSGDGAAEPALGFDQSVLNEIDKELESSDDEEAAITKKSSAASGRKVAVDAVAQKTVGDDRGAGGSLLGGLDQSVLNEIDEELATSSDDEDDGRGNGSSDVRRHTSESADKVRVDVVGGLPRQAGNGNGDRGATADIPRLSGLDATVSNAIDKELETSSDEEDTNRDAATTTEAMKSHRKGSESNARVENQRTLMSIADELDNELAALSYSSSSSDSDSSDSSDSDSDDGGDPMNGNADKNEVIVAVNEAAMEASKNLRETDPPSVPTATSRRETLSPSSVEPDPTNEVAGSTAQQREDNGERGASFASSTDKDAVVITTPVQKKPVTAVEEMYSPVVAPDVQPSTPEPLRLEARAASANRSADEEQSTVVVGSQESSVQVQVPETTQVAKTAGAASTSNDSQSRSDEIRAFTTPPLNTVTKSRSADRPADSEVSTAKIVKKVSIASPRDSILITTGLKNPARDNEVLPSRGVQESGGDASLEGDRVIGKPRKADEANLDDSTATAPKKVKRDETAVEERPDDTMPYTSSITGSKPVKKKSGTKVESKDEMRMKKSLAAFKQAIVLDKGEEASNEYARRTIAFLVNQSSKFIDTQLAHVTKLCHTLANAYRKLEITPMMAVRGALGVFRTPRSRRLMARNKQDLSWLCNQLLIMLMSGTDESQKQDESLCLSLADECLQHLRGLLVEERKNIGDSLSASRVEMQVSAPQVNVSHDKVFLAHICALHTHLCKSTGQLIRSRVLLFELLRDHPNIRGLYFAMTMLEIYPAIMEREFDEHCMERQVVLKETLQQVLVAIAGVAAERHELLLHQSSVTMLHSIAEAIQMPELEEVNGSNPRFSRSCVEKLVEQLSASCHPATPQDQTNAESFTKPVNYFELAKSLELCTAVFGLDLVTQILSIERCRELFVHANAEAKSGLHLVVGHIAMAIAPKTSDTRSPRTRSEDYVDGVLDWLYHILSTEADDDKTSPDDRFKVLLGCSTVCVELILENSASAGLDTRRRVLCAVVKWFDAMPFDRLFDLPVTFLRRLRLAVVAARAPAR